MTTVTALYDDMTSAKAAVADLVSAGFRREDISLIANDADKTYASYTTGTYEEDVDGDEGAGFGAIIGALVGFGAMLIPGIGPVVAAGPLAAALLGSGIGAAAGAVTGGLTASLVDTGIDEEDAGYFSEGVRRGGVLVVAHVNDEQAERVVTILNTHSPVDIHNRADQWRSSGWTGFTEEATPLPVETIKQERTLYSTPVARTADVADGTKLQVVQEEVQVGKREVEKGGVRVHSYVTERPVQTDVNLREEHVSVERVPVNRAATQADFATGEESFEVKEMAEEAVVQKQARVVEEVVVRKDVNEHTETINETVRRKDVDVENVASTDTSFDTYANRFQTHYKTSYGSLGRDYNYYMPAYRYGYTLANDPAYRGRDWSYVESAARTRWEEDNDTLWDDIKDAVRYGWDVLTGRS